LDGDQKVLALTFDLCETVGQVSGYDAAIINYLRSHQVRATFFAGGKWMRSHPEKTQQLMADPLFEIGNHSWSHVNFRKLRPSEMEQQILWTQAQYELLWEDLQRKVSGQTAAAPEMGKIPRVPASLRFPYGACTPSALLVSAQCGLPAIQWSVVSGDPAPGQSALFIAQTILRQGPPGQHHRLSCQRAWDQHLRRIITFCPSAPSQGFPVCDRERTALCGTSSGCDDLF
jgi:peptidoglycan-N-acetylglucosamine deacetylase